MALPEYEWLVLQEAAGRVARICDVPIDAAENRLDRAFRDRELVPTDATGKTVDAWDSAVIDWAQSSITWRPDGGYLDCILEDVHVSRLRLDDWAGLKRSLSRSASASQAARETKPNPRISQDELRSFLKELRQQLSKVPAKAFCETKARERFGKDRVTRLMVHRAHLKQFGPQRPGPRANSAD